MHNLLQPYFHPTKPHWQGRTYLFHPLILIKTALIIFILIPLCTTEIVLFNKWQCDDTSSSSSSCSNNEDYSLWWLLWGLVIFLEIPHIIAQLICVAYNANHPVFALVGSIFGFGLWTSFAILNGLVAYSKELWFEHNGEWMNMCFAESGVQALVAVLYVGMLVLSSVAVHRYRMDNKGGRDVELGDVKTGGGRRGDADQLSVRSEATLNEPHRDSVAEGKGV